MKLVLADGVRGENIKLRAWTRRPTARELVDSAFAAALAEAPRISPGMLHQAPDIFDPAGGGTFEFLADISAKIWG